VTYVVLSVAVIALLTLVCAPVLRRLPRWPLLTTGLVLLTLTVIFDNVIVGVGLVDYDASLISGVRMPIAPIEDLAYTVGAVLLIPTLWELFGRRRPEAAPPAHRPSDGTSPGDSA